MNNLYLIFLAVAPVAVLIVFILLHDRYDREPFSMLLKVFFFGMLISIPILGVEMLLSRFNFFKGIIGVAIQAFVVVGFTEEFFKRFVVIKSALYHKEFNEKLDGIVYCVIASLGFALVENVMYVFQFSEISASVWLTRAIVSVPAHMLLGIIMGYYLGMSKFGDKDGKTRNYYLMSLVAPAVLHGLFDFVLMAGLPNYLYYFVPILVFMWVI
ncbi:MAG: PrsW family intramembrane metalloprotease, partial [Clostridia bacterium]|nr:PrsW family intramembrane metalloprotease [Clostridia bacterium]